MLIVSEIPLFTFNKSRFVFVFMKTGHALFL